MDNFEEKLEQILGNSQVMEQIMSLAQSLGNNAPNPDPSTHNDQAGSPAESSWTDGLGLSALDPQMLTRLIQLLNQSRDGENERVALLQALRPFVKEQRYAKLDKAIQIARLSHLIRMALTLFRSKEDSYV